MKYLKMFGKIVLYFMVYIFTTIACTFIYAIVYVIVNSSNLSVAEFNAALLKNVFTLTAASAIVTFGIYVLMFRKKEINLFHRCKLKKISYKTSLIIVLSSLGLSLFSGSLVNILINIFPSYNEASAAIESNMSSILGVISVVLIIPILEEVLFRGLIYNELKTHLNIVIAIIFQSLLFAIAHGNMLQGIYAFIMGAVVAIIYDKTGSIFAPILFHVMYNLLGSIILPSILSGFDGYYIVLLIVGAIITALSLIPIFKNNIKEISIDTLYTQI
jgi:hypothetical protein